MVAEYTDWISAKKEGSPNECLDYDTEQSYGLASVMLGLCGMQRTLSLPSLPAPIWPGMVEPDRIQSMGSIEVFDI